MLNFGPLKEPHQSNFRNLEVQLQEILEVFYQRAFGRNVMGFISHNQDAKIRYSQGTLI